MITAEEYCRKHQNSNHPDMINKLMIEFAQQAIKADRINLLNYAEIEQSRDNSNIAEIRIDKDSIINAPNITLL